MFKKDQRTEDFLRNLGVDFDYLENLKMTDLWNGWDKKNASRDGAPIIFDAAGDYATRMRNGEEPPAVICTLTTDGKLFPRDGRQRLWAARSNQMTLFSAYVVNSDNPLTLQMIELGANTRINGSAPPNKQYIIQRAVDLHLREGVSLQELERSIGVTLKSMSEEMVCREVAERLDKMKLPGSQFKKGQLLSLGMLLKDGWFDKAPKGIRNLCEIVLGAGLLNGRVSEVAERICKFTKKNPETQINTVCRELKDDPEIGRRLRGKGSGKREPVENVITHLRKLRTVVLTAKRANAVATEKEEEAVLELHREITTYMRFILKQGVI